MCIHDAAQWAQLTLYVLLSMYVHIFETDIKHAQILIIFKYHFHGGKIV